MAKWVPFTAHIEITPNRGAGKRQEIWRDMQKIATNIYQALSGETTLHLANPGGGQHTSRSGHGHGGMGGMTAGMAAKPQIGEAPAQVMITGFYESQTPNIQPQPEKQLISTNEIWTGPGATPHLVNPVNTISNEVLACKNTIENAIMTDLPNLEFEIFRLDYSGITYGDKGYHFPL